MKQSEIIIGNEYMTKVSGALVRVRVTDSTWSNPTARTRYYLTRCDNDLFLPKPRSAAALRPVSP